MPSSVSARHSKDSSITDDGVLLLRLAFVLLERRPKTNSWHVVSHLMFKKLFQMAAGLAKSIALMDTWENFMIDASGSETCPADAYTTLTGKTLPRMLGTIEPQQITTTQPPTRLERQPTTGAVEHDPSTSPD